jgi:hypothetical protein
MKQLFHNNEQDGCTSSDYPFGVKEDGEPEEPEDLAKEAGAGDKDKEGDKDTEAKKAPKEKTK